jgi:HEAT repeat protein
MINTVHNEQLLEALNKGDWNAMIEAAAEPETVSLLLSVVLSTRDEIVRQSATGALGSLAELMVPSAIDALLTVLTQLERSYARDIAAFYLVGCGDTRAAVALREILNDSRHAAHLPVVRALAEAGDPIAVDPLIAALNNSRLPVRHELVRVLGDYDDVRVVFPLLRLLHHEDERVAAAARHALHTFATKYAYGTLIEYLTHQDYTARRQAAIALGEIGSRRAIKPLIRLVDGETDGRVRQAIRDALHKLGYAYEARSG